jgi:hypothetical protein
MTARKKARSGWLTLTIIVWLLFLSLLVVSALVQLENIDWKALRGQPTDGQTAAQVQNALTQDIENLALRLTSETQGLREATQAELAAIKDALKENSAAVSEQLTGQAVETAGEITALKDQVKTLEARFAERQTVIASELGTRPQPVTRPPPSTKPPFQVIGVEQRGGERFLTVMRMEGQSVADIELLCVGTRTGQWFLEAIEEDFAVFRLGDGIVRLTIPRLPVSKGGA